MPILVYINVFALGLVFGSFLNTVIYRLYEKKDFIKGRSVCPHCGHPLRWDDLIPVLSFIMLKGKCRYCGKPISRQYPLVELLTGTLFVFVFYQNADLFFNFLSFGLLKIIYLFFVTCSLIVIGVYDFNHRIIPNGVIYSLIGGTFLWYLISSVFFQTYTLNELLEFFVAGFYSAAFFWLINVITQGKGMGMGDAKLGFFMGLFFGYPNVLSALFLSFFLGSIIGVSLIVLKKKKFKSVIPFAPFLVIGTFIVMFFNQWFLDLKLFGF